MIISLKSILKSCIYFSIIFIMFYNISYSAETIQQSMPKIKAETKLNLLPNVSFINLADEKIDLKKVLKKNILIINFWALWCTPCVKEMPTLKELSDKLNNNTKILFINQDGLKDYKRVIEFIEKLGINKNNVLVDFDMQSNKNFQLR